MRPALSGSFFHRHGSRSIHFHSTACLNRCESTERSRLTVPGAAPAEVRAFLYLSTVNVVTASSRIDPK